MRTMKVGKMLLGLAALLGLVLATATTASATWIVTYDAVDPWGGDNIARVNGGADTNGYYYTSDKPETGDWTLTYNLAPIAKDAGWCSTPLTVWSADRVYFQTFGSSTMGPYTMPSDLEVKVVLSEEVVGATWTAYFAVYASSNYVRSQYSTNGSDWTTVGTYDASAGDGTMYSYVYDLSFAPATELYLRLNADAGAVWLTAGGTGNNTVVFTPVPEPVTMAVLGAGALMCLLRRRNRS